MNLVNSVITAVIVLFVGYAVNTVADSSTQSVSKPVSTTINQSMVKESQADTDFTEAAKRWGLSVSEYQRYTEITKGPLGRWNPTIDPVLALGIYADNETDQQRYAEHYAQQEFELTQRTQAFERAYHIAFNRLYPDVGLIDRQRLQPYYHHQQQKALENEKEKQWGKSFNSSFSPPRFQVADRLLYFPRVDCQRCGPQVQYWTTLLKSLADTGIDIYVVGAENADQVRQWAKANAIEPEWIKAGLVTLNVDSGLSARLAEQGSGEGSSLYLSRGQSMFALNAEQLSL